MNNLYNDEVLRYIRGEMESKESSDFEYQLEQNPDLYREYQYHQNVRQATALNFQRQKKKMLEDLEGKEKYQKKRSKVFIYSGAATALAAALVLLAIFFTGNNNPKTLADQHFKPFPDYVTERYRGSADNASQTSDEKIFRKGMTAYRASSYEKAATLLRQAIDQNQQKALSKLYLGNALMASDKPGKAIEHLEGLKDKLKPDYQMQQQWYLALAYVKTGQFSKAQPLLDKLTKGEIFQHQEAAQELRNAIE
jgi:predicted Zn-dependent protease